MAPLHPPDEVDAFDVVIVGGGLQGCLAVLALAAARPTARVALIERAPALCGNHTWCLHADDVPAELAEVVAPALVHHWPGYDVAFPAHARALASPYAAATSASLAAAVATAVAARPSFAVWTSVEVRALTATAVELADGRRVAARRVVDARGPDRLSLDPTACGYQKFVGAELELSRPHGLERPVLMDATVPQRDGFRFVYVLPLSPTRVLVEDTYFSDGPELRREELLAGVHAEAERRGFAVARVVRTEEGVLPLPLTLPPAPCALGAGPLEAGYQGGWFHPTTGYSFPLALRVAAFLAHDADAPDAAARWQALATSHRAQLTFALRLNKMLFRWFPPDERHHVLARFYRLPEETVRRFYALRTTRGDRARILCGRPPRGMSWRAVLTGARAS